MHAWLAAVLLAAIVAGCSDGGHTGAATTSPRTAAAPRIEPPFLPTSVGPDSVARFACPKHPVSTVDLESCSSRRILALDARINERIEIIWHRLGNAKGRRPFVRAESAWRTYVKTACISRSRSWVDPSFPYGYAGGTEARVRYAICEEELTTAHLRWLS